VTPAGWEAGRQQMNPLRRIENAIAGLVEGGFGRVFRSEVRPMELAHKLAREMDEHATVSVSRTYAPNEYSVWLSPRDRARYAGVEHEVIGELCAYLLEHARREDMALASGPRVTFHTDEDLGLGEFGIQARMTKDDEPSEQGGHTMIYSNSERVREEMASGRPGAGSSARAGKAMLVVGGRRVVVPAGGAVLGRSRECDVVLDDSGVSRRHAQLLRRGEGWVLEDLQSTNGVRVNGRELEGVRALRAGDRIELGSTEMRFEVA
jgi:hypothetical protein